jgi:hypothetical protein
VVDGVTAPTDAGYRGAVTADLKRLDEGRSYLAGDTPKKNINPSLRAMEARFVALGRLAGSMTSSQFGPLMANAADMSAKVIASANIRLN